MPTTSEILNEVRMPKYINCKSGFVKLLHHKGQITFLGFTPNLRTATPLYGSTGEVYAIAKKLLGSMYNNAEYFAIVEPSLIGFNKEKERAS